MRSAALWWIGWGLIKLRRWNLLQMRRERNAKLEGKASTAIDGLPMSSSRSDLTAEIDDPYAGWQHRTIVVTNITNDMRSEEALTKYFIDGLNRKRPQSSAASSPPMHSPGTFPPAAAPIPQEQLTTDGAITEVVLVRRTLQIHETFKKRTEVLHQSVLPFSLRDDKCLKQRLSRLEKAHIYLARRALQASQLYLAQQEKAKTSLPGTPASLPMEKQATTNSRILHPRKHREEEKTLRDVEKADPADMALVAATLKDYLPNSTVTPDRSIWEALKSLPPEALDRFQPLYHLQHLFTGQAVPSIDYHLTKLNIITALLQSLRESVAESCNVGPSAFVTFASAADARRVAREMPVHRTRTWAMKVDMAPDVRDSALFSTLYRDSVDWSLATVEWDKLAAMSFRGDIIRSFVVQVLFWYV